MLLKVTVRCQPQMKKKGWKKAPLKNKKPAATQGEDDEEEEEEEKSLLHALRAMTATEQKNHRSRSLNSLFLPFFFFWTG